MTYRFRTIDEKDEQPWQYTDSESEAKAMRARAYIWEIEEMSELSADQVKAILGQAENGFVLTKEMTPAFLAALCRDWLAMREALERAELALEPFARTPLSPWPDHTEVAALPSGEIDQVLSLTAGNFREARVALALNEAARAALSKEPTT